MNDSTLNGYAVKAYQHLYRQPDRSMTYADFVDDAREFIPNSLLDSVVAYMTRCDWVVIWQDANEIYWISVAVEPDGDTSHQDGGGSTARSSSSSGGDTEDSGDADIG